MNNQMEDRVRAAIRALADEPAIAPSAGWEPADRPQSTRPRWIPIAAALGVLLVTLLVVIKPWSPPPPPATSDDPPMFPREIASLSLLTSTLSEAPLGRPAVAVVRQRGGAQLKIMTQVSVIGDDGRTYRRVDLAEQRGDWDATGKKWTNAQALLAPNGRRVAIGGGAHKSAELPVLNLVTGERRDYRFAEPTAYWIKGWSPDGQRLALVIDRRLVLLDLASGAFTTVDGMSALDTTPMVFLPDGRIVLQSDFVLSFVDRAGKLVRSLDRPDVYMGVLKGRSPDGSRLIFIASSEKGYGMHFIRASTLKEDGPWIRATENAFILGVRSPDEVLVYDPDWYPHDLLAVSVRTGESTVVSSMESMAAGPVKDIDVAVDLLPKMQFVDASPERGSLPGVVWLGMAVILALVVAAILLWRRWRRHDGRSIRRPMWTISVILAVVFGILRWYSDVIASWDSVDMRSGIFIWLAGMAVVLVVVVALTRYRSRLAAWIAGLIGAFLISELATIAFFWSDTFPWQEDESVDVASVHLWYLQALVESGELPWYWGDNYGGFPQAFALFALIAIWAVIRQSAPERSGWRASGRDQRDAWLGSRGSADNA